MSRSSTTSRRRWAALLAFLGAYAAWQIAGWGGAGARPLVGDASFVPINVAAILAALGAARRSAGAPRLVRGWRLVAAGLACYLLGDAVQVAFSLAYPAGDLVLLVGLAWAAWRAPGALGRTTGRWLTVALLLYVAADVVYGYVSLHGGYAGGDPLDALWILALAASCVAGWSHDGPRPAPAVRCEGRRNLALFPYLAPIAVFALVVVTEWGEEFTTHLSVVLAAAGAGTLSVVRQLLAQRRLARTVERLDAAEQQTRTVLGAAPVVLFSLDADGVVTLAEGSRLATLGYTSAELVGRPVSELSFYDAVSHDMRRALGADSFTAV